MAPPKRPWFRFYVEAVHDRKLRRLKPETRWLFVACLAAARQSPTPGHLLVARTDPMTWSDLMDFAGMTRKQVEDGMDALADAGVVAFDSTTDVWSIPNWNERQYESDDVTSRTRRHRSKDAEETTMERSKNGDGTSDGTPPENREQRTETEGVTPARTHHGLLRPDAPPPLLVELDRTIEALIAVYGPDDVERSVQDLLDQRLRFPFPSKVRQAIEGTLTKPATAFPSPTDDTQRAQRQAMERTDRRKRGEVCPFCEDRGVVELEDGTFDDCRCKSLRSA